MDFEILLKLAAPFIGLLVTLLEFFRKFGGPSARDRLVQDVQIRNVLPANSDAQRAFDEHIKREALRLIDTSTRRRDPFGITVASIFLVIGIASIWIIYSNDGGWWWLLSPLVAFFLLFGVVGLASDIPKKERDDRGRAIKSTG